MAKALIEQAGGPENSVYYEGLIYRFVEEKGYWKVLETLDIEALAYNLDLSLTNNQLLSVPKHIVRDLHINGEVENFKGGGGNRRATDHPSRYKVCVKGGTLNMRTGEVEPNDKQNHLTHYLPIEYDPEAKAPRFEQFLEETFVSPEEANTYLEFCGLTLVDDTSFHKALFLLGRGGTGKSKALDILTCLHHEDHVSYARLADIDKERTLTSLVGKMLLASSEVSGMSTLADDVFKRLVEGAGVEVRKLYNEPRSVHMSTRILATCNELPRLRAESASDNSIRRRTIILKCDNIVPDDKRDLHLLEKLRAELPGILNIYTKAYMRLRERGDFEKVRSIEHSLDEYVKEADLVARWADERLARSGGKLVILSEEEKADWAPCSALYENFKEWCEHVAGVSPRFIFGDVRFGKMLSNMGVPPKKAVRLPVGVKACRPVKIDLGGPDAAEDHPF